MSRDIHTDTLAAIQRHVVRPVLIGRLDIMSDPIVAWTGPGIFAPTGSGDSAMDGYTFAPIAPFMKITDITEDQGIGGPTTITVAGHDLDETALRQIVRDKRQWRGRKAYLWMGLLDTDQHSVIANPIRIKTGVITQMITNRSGDDASVSVVIDRDLGNAKSAPFRWIDHLRMFPDDTWAAYIIKLANKPQGLENFDINDAHETTTNDSIENIL